MSIVPLRSRIRAGASALTRFAGSDRFFLIIVIFFALQSLWIVFSARYPLAFDEDFHFGLIQLHANQWLPFFTSQPPHAQAYGSVVRDPSYLYHFLMSVPYRLIRLLTTNQVAQILVLRIINVGIFTGSLIVFRRLLLRLGSSRQLTHLTLLIFTLIPIVPYLAAHINYDNLFLLLTAWILLLACDWLDNVASGRISAIQTMLLVSLMMLTSLVKYTFLPIAIGIGACMLWQIIRYTRKRTAWRDSLLRSVRSAVRWQLIIVVLLLGIATALFTERFGINVIRYHTPSPDCGQVLDVNSCVQYGPWGRDYVLAQNKPNAHDPTAPPYIKSWLRGMWQRSFFAISGKLDDASYDAQPPLPVPAITAVVIVVLAAGLCGWYGLRIVRRQPRWLYMLVPTAVYIAALFLQTYQSFERTGVPVAINGRYLIPFMPVLFLFGALGFRELLAGYETMKAILATLLIVLMLQGGGTMTFILRSKDVWLWPNTAVVHVNNAARGILQPVVIGSRETDLFPIRP